MCAQVPAFITLILLRHACCEFNLISHLRRCTLSIMDKSDSNSRDSSDSDNNMMSAAPGTLFML